MQIHTHTPHIYIHTQIHINISFFAALLLNINFPCFEGLLSEYFADSILQSYLHSYRDDKDRTVHDSYASI